MQKLLYCRVAFGPDMRLRVWFICHGDTIYLNRSGDATPRMAERLGESPVERAVELSGPDGRTRYTLNRISAFKGDHEPCLMLDADINGTSRYQQYGWALMAERPDRAGLAHFDGPLTVHPIRRRPNLPPLRFVRNGKPKYIRAVVATDLLPEHGSWVAVRSQSLRGNQPALPLGVVPTADVDFLPRLSGRPTVHERLALDEFC